MSTASSYSGLWVLFGSFKTSGLVPLVFPMIQIMEKPLPSSILTRVEIATFPSSYPR